MTNLKPRSFEDFEREVRETSVHANVIPVVRTVIADVQSPVDAFSRLAGNSQYAFLFESVEGGESLARYSFIGIDPEMIVHGRGNQTIVERHGSTEVREMPLPEFIREHFRSRKLAARSGLAPLAGGGVGFFGFQATSWFEPAFASQKTSRADDAVWMFFRTVLALDRTTQKAQIVSVVFCDEAEGDHSRLKQLYEDAVRQTALLETRLLDEQEKSVTGERANARQSSKGEAETTSNWSRAGFENAVRAVKEHIAAGDCFQVVISQCFTRSVSADPLSIYRALRATNPSPYLFYLRLGAETILGASPEMLVRCRGRELEYRPIAGTRPRGVDDVEDQQLGEELRADEKEVAEHMMLVDLGRNDLGRVAEYGSVHVAELMTVERYSHVQHLVSSLRARLRDGLDRFDALAACFPAGTVTGAPKVRAMEIIQEFEPSPRGVYSGTILYADYADNLDSCIAIRTMVIDGDGNAFVQAGAGIVADSIPEREYEETVNKARALFRAIEIAEQGGGNREEERRQAGLPDLRGAATLPKLRSVKAFQSDNQSRCESARDREGRLAPADPLHETNHRQKILVIDNYDSFTYNLVQYLGGLGAQVVVRRNDQLSIEEVATQLRPERIVISPGPGVPEDAGITLDLITNFAGKVPLLGVCLGHQAIAQSFGGSVVRAEKCVHGKFSEVSHDGNTIFQGLSNRFSAGRYHSLIVERESLPSCLEISATTSDGIIMGIRHRKFNVEGVQFHPESILTGEGKKLLANFLSL